MASASLLGVSICALAASGLQITQVPSPPMSAEHHLTPELRTVDVEYTCKEGSRSIKIVYDRLQKARITRLSRNGYRVPRHVVDKINEHLGYLDHLSGVHPQCGLRDDTLSASGRKAGAHAGIQLRWSMTNAIMSQVLE